MNDFDQPDPKLKFLVGLSIMIEIISIQLIDQNKSMFFVWLSSATLTLIIL